MTPQATKVRECYIIRDAYSYAHTSAWSTSVLRPVLLQDYFGTISGTISSTTNSTEIVPETSKKNDVFGGGFRYYSWYYLWYYFFDVIMSCDQDKTGTGGLHFLVDARRSCCPCCLLPLASAAAIVATFSTAAFS